MNAFQYAKLLESITLYGFLDPILARPCVLHGDLEIVGGFHRWTAAGDLGVDPLPFIVKDMDDLTARKVSIIDNELHGQADPQLLGDLLKDIVNDSSVEDSLKAMPFTDEILKSLTGLSSLPPLPSVAPPGSPLPPGESTGKEKWVERTYRMPAGVAEVLDEAIGKARAELANYKSDPISDVECLEVVAAEYLASG